VAAAPAVMSARQIEGIVTDVEGIMLRSCASG